MEFVDIKSDIIQCRACTIEMNKCEMIHLYKEPNLSQIFLQCTAIKISESDSFPEFMCPDCNYLLIKLNDFRQICHTSDKFFREQALENLIKIENEIKIEPLFDDTIPQLIDVMDKKKESKRKSEAVANLKNGHAQSSSDEQFPNDIDDKDYFNNAAIIVQDKPIDLFGEGFYCDLCDCKKKFLQKNRIEAHMRKHFGLKPFQCNLCDKSYAKCSSLSKHKGSIHCQIDGTNRVNKKHICNICGKMYYNKLRLDGHMREHQGLKQFVCNICNKEYTRLTYLNSHIKVEHNKDGTFEKIDCTYAGCDKTFNYRATLRVHIRNVHQADIFPKRTYVCDVCGRSFGNSFRLNEHSYTHTGEKPFSCERCPKKFTTKKSLKSHTLRHDNIRNHVCTICGQRKVTSKELKIHLNYHTKERTYPCTKCPKIFNGNNNLRSHFRIVHMDYKPYKCEHCNRTFSKSGTLKHHVMTHTGEKPLACTICDKRFIQLAAIRAHMKVHNK